MFRDLSITLPMTITMILSPASAEASQTLFGGVSVLRGGEEATVGSGKLVRQDRVAGPFDRIEAGEGVNIEIAIAPQRSVQVEADDNLIQRVTTRVEGGLLKIGATGSYSTRVAPIVRVTTPNLRSVRLQTSSSAAISGLNGGGLKLSSNGSGAFDVRGALNSIVVELNGSGTAQLSKLIVGDVVALVNGSSKVRVNASRTISAEVNGSGSLVYEGNPTFLRRSRAGGTICRVDRCEDEN